MNRKALSALLIAGVFLALFLLALIPEDLGWSTPPGGGSTVGQAMWESRTFEILVQGLVLLGGVVAILLLLGTRRTQEAGP